MKATVLCAAAAAAAVLAAAPARAIEATVCQPAGAGFTSVQARGRGFAGILETPTISFPAGEDCLLLAGFEFPSIAVLAVKWSKSGEFRDHTSRCSVIDERCTFPLSDLESAANVTVCQPAGAGFTLVEATGIENRGLRVSHSGNLALGEDCFFLAGSEFPSNAVLTVRWSNSSDFQDHALTCRARDESCTFPLSALVSAKGGELKPIET